MVETTLVEEQLKRIKFNANTWNRAETQELATIILPNEEIYECANGWYEGGFALIVATNIRVVLIDKKPFKYLAVEDLRFDMINEIDYSHRLFDARINITTGAKTLSFRSYNQQRLRKLITHVQHRMAEIKHEQVAQNGMQQEHLKQIDQKLHAYLVAQFQQYPMQMQAQKPQASTVAPIEPFSPEEIRATKDMLVWDGKTFDRAYKSSTNGASAAQLYEDGRKEVFGRPTGSAHNDPVSSLHLTIFKHRLFGRTILTNLLIRHPNLELAF